MNLKTNSQLSDGASKEIKTATQSVMTGGRSYLMALFLGLAAFLFTWNALADRPSFVYDDHGKHDPFIPLVTATGSYVTYDSDLNVGDLVLEGIVADASGQNAAIINGKVVSAGDSVGSYTIESIDEDAVNLIQGDQKSVLKLKKGGL